MIINKYYENRTVLTQLYYLLRKGYGKTKLIRTYISMPLLKPHVAPDYLIEK